jgi:hypothetical protein
MRHVWTRGGTTVEIQTRVASQLGLDGAPSSDIVEITDLVLNGAALTDARFDSRRGMLNGYRDGNRFDIIVPDHIRSKIFRRG